MIAGLSIPVCRVCPQSEDNIRWESVLEELLSDEDLTPDSREDLQSRSSPSCRSLLIGR